MLILFFQILVHSQCSVTKSDLIFEMVVMSQSSNLQNVCYYILDFFTCISLDSGDWLEIIAVKSCWKTCWNLAFNSNVANPYLKICSLYGEFTVFYLLFTISSLYFDWNLEIFLCSCAKFLVKVPLIEELIDYVQYDRNVLWQDSWKSITFTRHILPRFWFWLVTPTYWPHWNH